MDIADHLSIEQLEGILRPINPGSPIVVSKRGVPENFNLGDFLHADALTEHTAFLDWLRRGDEFILSNQPLGCEDHGGRSTLHPIGNKEVSLLSTSNRVHTFSLRRDGMITGNSFVIWLNLLTTMKGENILRLKAILNVEGRPIALHGTHTIIHEPIAMLEWPSADHSSRFVVITNGPIQKQFERSLELLDFNVQKRDEVSLINPDSYQNFLKLAESFSRV